MRGLQTLSQAMIGTLLLAAPAAAQTPDGTYNLSSDSRVEYHLVHPLHRVKGVSSALRGQVVIAQGRLRTPLSFELPFISFRSGNKNRDGNAALTLEVHKFPLVSLLVERFNETRRQNLPDGSLNVQGEAFGTLTLHGAKQSTQVPMQVTWKNDRLVMSGEFNVSLTAHNIPRPALLFQPVEDTVRVVVEATAQRTPLNAK